MLDHGLALVGDERCMQEWRMSRARKCRVQAVQLAALSYRINASWSRLRYVPRAHHHIGIAIAVILVDMKLGGSYG
jgi:hypothetical protein